MSAPPTDFNAHPGAADATAAQLAFESGEVATTPRQAADQFLQATDEAEAGREWLLAAEAASRAGDRLAPTDPARAARLYQRAAADFEKVGHFAAGRKMAYRESGLKLWRGGEWGLSRRTRVELLFAWLTSGFGLKPLRVLGCAAAAWVGFALVFWAGGGVLDPDGRPLPGFADALYLSGVTISTVGYGDVMPVRHLRFAAAAEGWLGLILFGYFVAVLSNRLRH